MKTLEALKAELFENLKQCPEIEAFFKDSLRKRVELDNTWIENPLAVFVLDKVYTHDNTLSEWIQMIAQSPQNYEPLRKKLTLNHTYDQSVHDVLAEVRAYCDIKISGFSEITAIPESSHKTPDFSAVLNRSRYLFEVKNIRFRTDVQEFLWDKLIARRLLAPEHYENLQLDIQLTRAWEEIDFADETSACLRSELIDWFEKFFDNIENEEKPEKLTNSEFIASQDNELRVKCHVKEGSRLTSIGFSHARELSIDRRRELLPFFSRVVGKIKKGSLQLFEYDGEDECEKYVLLSFPYQGAKILMEEQLQAIIHGLDALVKNINDKLHVRWLHRDNLP